MKILKWIYLVFIHLLLLISLIGWSEQRDIRLASPENPLNSPTGNYQLQVVEGFDGQVHFNRFAIAKNEPHMEPIVVYSSHDTFRTRDRLYFFWDSAERVWVWSSDIGLFYWTKTTDDRWDKHSYAEEPIDIPEVFRELEPNLTEQYEKR